MTPTVVKIVNGTASSPSCSVAPEGVMAPRSDKDDPRAEDHRQRGDRLRDESYGGRQLDEVVDETDADQQDAGQQEAQDFRDRRPTAL